MNILSFKNGRKLNDIQGIVSNLKVKICLRFLVFATCSVVVIIQLYECWHKVKNPPIITHTRLTMNETLSYPALTICREPPYNRRYYKQFNFTGLHLGSYPITSLWNDFPYDTYNISDFWDIAVYNSSVITCYGLSDLPLVQIDLQSSLHLTTGMCHTLRPRKPVPAVGKKPGYHIMLRHDLYQHDPSKDKEAAGWYIYIHEVKEKFSENFNIHPGRQALVFVPVGEKVEATLDAIVFSSVQNCSRSANYSLAECEEDCWVEEDVKGKVNCSGPWFPKLKMPHCNEANGMIDLIKATLAMKNPNCCMKSCETTQYKSSIVKRTPFPPMRKYTSIAWIYFASKAVITVEERYSYNWNVFISDLGGSVGFLLGLSVIGMIAYVEKVVGFFWKLKARLETEPNPPK